MSAAVSILEDKTKLNGDELYLELPFLLAGAGCLLRTNSPALLECVQRPLLADDSVDVGSLRPNHRQPRFARAQ